jgi:hypothetical protein
VLSSRPSFELRRNHLGVLLVLGKEGEPLLQQRLELGVLRGRDERGAERIVDRLVEATSLSM